MRSLLLALLPVAALHAQSASGAPAPADAIPAHATFTIASTALGESRPVNVHVPADYASTHHRYPVLYMPDGGLDEDFPHVVNTVDSLAALGKVPPVIVVGIPNTERRRDLTGPTTVASDSAIAPHVGGSAAFRAFIRDELMPEVRRRYRTSGETAVVGESLAGLFIMETFLEEPLLFRRYIALSPSLWWNSSALVQAAEARLAAMRKAPERLFLAAANEEGIADNTAAVARLITARRLHGLRFRYTPRPDLEHSTIFRALGPTALAEVLGR